MEHLTKPSTKSDCAPPGPRTVEQMHGRADRSAAARIPDSVALLSYGTPVLGRFGGGPRLI